jgi:hypothetical protein
MIVIANIFECNPVIATRHEEKIAAVMLRHEAGHHKARMPNFGTMGNGRRGDDMIARTLAGLRHGATSCFELSYRIGTDHRRLKDTLDAMEACGMVTSTMRPNERNGLKPVRIWGLPKEVENA